ncbi:MAG: hypothetical protein E6Q35_06980 [Chryseobacterium cucumeris]|nr:MAG: hypothetical protein E6Q35_06980 [Chryseobacterium cucumeris]
MNNPLQYFEDLLQTDQSETKKQFMISDYLEKWGAYGDVKEDREKGIIEHTIQSYDEDTRTWSPATGILTFEDFFKKEVDTEKENAKKTISENLFVISSQTGNSKNDYLKHLVDRLQFLADKAVKIYTSYVFIYEALREIILYIKENYFELSKGIDFISVLASIEISKDYTFASDHDTIMAIIGYLKLYNTSREKILSDEDFDYLISKLDELHSTGVLPELPRKINTVNISKNLLSYTFWLLHKYLYGTKSIKPYYLEFVKSIFSCFDSWELGTFKKKFGNKDKVTFHGERFIPSIIVDELRS